MPAAAVIPAPIGYINVVAVKKLVVEFLLGCWPSREQQCFCVWSARHLVDVWCEWFTLLASALLRY